jgi:hypothetical protein
MKNTMFNAQMLVQSTLTAEQVEEWSQEKCQDALRTCMGLTVESIKAAAMIVAVMDRKQFKLDFVPANYLTGLRRVYQRTLLPETLIHCAGMLRVAVGGLSLDEQQRLMREHQVEVVVRDGTDTMMIDIAHLQLKQIRQVFAPGHIRTVPEQKAWLEANPEQQRQRLEAYYIDPERSAFVVTRPCDIKLSKLIRLLKNSNAL